MKGGICQPSGQGLTTAGGSRLPLRLRRDKTVRVKSKALKKARNVPSPVIFFTKKPDDNYKI
jgi:hypothetical protein